RRWEKGKNAPPIIPKWASPRRSLVWFLGPRPRPAGATMGCQKTFSHVVSKEQAGLAVDSPFFSPSRLRLNHIR
ncbi:hypothetical protein EMPG_16176, partial [Blastomyces silverae]